MWTTVEETHAKTKAKARVADDGNKGALRTREIRRRHQGCRKARRRIPVAAVHWKISDGLRTYAEYRDLGIKDATAGMVVAHAIRFVAPCDPKIVSKEHYHDTEFQMIYVLKGSIVSSFEGQGTHTMKAGDCWLQPQRIKHKVLDYSEDCELLEIVMPADFKTVELEK